MDIGFIGLGTMGRAMAANLVRAGHRLRVWNRSPEPVAALTAIGAQRAATPAAAAEADCLISMLADDQAASEVLLDGAAVERLPPQSFHVNMATVSVALARELTAAHARYGSGYLAAPVMGRGEAAATGALVILAAGPAHLIARAQPVFDVLGQSTWMMGTEPVQGNAVKLAMNFMLVSAIEAMAEAAALVQSHGMATTTFVDMLTATTFRAPVYATYGALLAERRYSPAGFKLSLGLKDVRLALAAADATRASLPFARVLQDKLSAAVARGDGDLDLAALGDIR
jgi:3-hydroxyisobutyrate dehydrogenase-like beta-hydroxyacid dehydrogenase